MAGDWSKIEHGLRDKPEVIAMSTILAADRDLIAGKLLRLWEWFDKNTSDGCAHGVTQAFIDSLVALDGFASALESVGWLSIRNGSILQPKFDRHNSKSAKARALANERMKRSRYAASATKAQPEKRREEKRDKPPIPPSLDTPEFRLAWDDFSLHRSEIRKPLTATAERRLLGKLQEWGALRAVAAIEHSIASGWQGIFEDKSQAAGSAREPLRMPTPEELANHNPAGGPA